MYEVGDTVNIIHNLCVHRPCPDCILSDKDIDVKSEVFIITEVEPGSRIVRLSCRGQGICTFSTLSIVKVDVYNWIKMK